MFPTKEAVRAMDLFELCGLYRGLPAPKTDEEQEILDLVLLCWNAKQKDGQANHLMTLNDLDYWVQEINSELKMNAQDARLPIEVEIEDLTRAGRRSRIETDYEANYYATTSTSSWTTFSVSTTSATSG